MGHVGLTSRIVLSKGKIRLFQKISCIRIYVHCAANNYWQRKYQIVPENFAHMFCMHIYSGSKSFCDPFGTTDGPSLDSNIFRTNLADASSESKLNMETNCHFFSVCIDKVYHNFMGM